MASGNDQSIHEIFADNDSVNEDEFARISAMLRFISDAQVVCHFLNLENVPRF
jgi:hypothetical protein